MWLRKTKLLPGTAPGGHVWESAADQVEVDDQLGMDLCEIPDAGFVEIPPAEVKTAGEVERTEVSEAPTGRRGRKPAAAKDSADAAPDAAEVKE